MKSFEGHRLVGWVHVQDLNFLFHIDVKSERQPCILSVINCMDILAVCVDTALMSFSSIEMSLALKQTSKHIFYSTG